MNMFESVSSEVQTISDSRSRQETIACLHNILEITLPHPELSSVSNDISTFINSIDSNARTMRRGQVVKRLKKRVLPVIESLAASLDEKVPTNVIKTVERVVVTAAISRGSVLTISSEMLYDASSKSKGQYLRTLDDIKLFRKIVYAPYNHARLGLDVLASIADNLTQSQRESILAKLKPVLFADEAVKKVYEYMTWHPELEYKEIVTISGLRADPYCDKFFPRSMSTRVTTGQYGDSNKFKDVSAIRRGINRLVESRKHLKELTNLSPVLAKKHASAFTDRSWLFLENMGDALRPIGQLAREKNITTTQKSLRDQMADKFNKKIPTTFDAMNAFTMTSLPVEAFIAGSQKFREPTDMQKYGLRLVKEQVGSKKNDASFFYMDQPILFFERDMLIDHMLEELTETARSSLDDYNVQIREYSRQIKAHQKNIAELETDRAEATKKEARQIDNEIDKLSQAIEKATSFQQTVKTTRATAKKELDRRIKHFSKNPNEVLDRALRFVIETINERSTTDYTLVSSVYNPNPKSPKSSMAWLMPTAQYNALEGSMGKISVSKWNLPWVSKHTPSAHKLKALQARMDLEASKA